MLEREPSMSRGQPNSASAKSAAGARSADAGPPATAASRASGRPARSSGPTFYAAGFWHRLGAALIDLAIIVPVALVLAWLSGKITGVALPASRTHGLDFWLDLLLASDPALFGILGLLLATALVYILVFQLTQASTPGMRLARIHIIDLYGDAPSVPRIVARTAGYLAAVATLGLGFVWIGFDSEKRGLHDWLSGTYVVKA